MGRSSRLRNSKVGIEAGFGIRRATDTSTELRAQRFSGRVSGGAPSRVGGLGRELVGDADELDPRPDQYTFWSNRGESWKKNVGWRIDYHIATPKLAAAARATSIYKDKRFSDHAPLIVDYDYDL